MSTFKNLAGQRFGYLLAIAPIAKTPQGKWKWVCVCQCGTVRNVCANSLKTGNTVSCGCFNQEQRGKPSLTHGMSKTPEYSIWKGILRRCRNTTRDDFVYYGGRGITCEFLSFADFYAEVGKRPSPNYSIDRIDNNLPYQKGNVRWATQYQQKNNTRNNKLFTQDGVTKSIAEWARYCGVKYYTFIGRMKRGKSLEEAMYTPIRKIHKYHS